MAAHLELGHVPCGIAICPKNQHYPHVSIKKYSYKCVGLFKFPNWHSYVAVSLLMFTGISTECVQHRMSGRAGARRDGRTFQELVFLLPIYLSVKPDEGTRVPFRGRYIVF
jgi:hypothetical protein